MLQQFANGIQIRPFISEPVKLGTEPPPTPIPNTAALSRAQAQSALMGTVAKTLSDLPSTIAGNYLQGENIGVTTAKNDLLKQVYSGAPLSDSQKAVLAGTGIYDPYAAPKAAASLASTQATTAHTQAETAAITNTPFAQLDAAYNGKGTPAATPAGDTVQGTVFGLVPSGQTDAAGNPTFMDDPNDAIDAAKAPASMHFDAHKGAWGANIKDPSLQGVALPLSALQSAGVNLDPKAGDPASQGFMAEVTDGMGQKYTVPIVDKNGRNTIDLTYGLYTKMGGMNAKGGNNIKGLSYRIVKSNGNDDLPLPVKDSVNDPTLPAATVPVPSAQPNAALTEPPAPPPANGGTYPDGTAIPAAVPGGRGALSDPEGVTASDGMPVEMSDGTNAYGTPRAILASDATPTAGGAPAPGNLSGETDMIAPGVPQGKGALGRSAPPQGINAIPGGGNIVPMQGMRGYIYTAPTGEKFMALPGQKELKPLKDPNLKSQGYPSVAAMRQALSTGPDGGTVADYTVDASGLYHPGKILPNAKISAATRKMVDAANYVPQPGEDEETIAHNAKAKLDQMQVLSPAQMAARKELVGEMTKDPQIKSAFDAMHAMQNVDAALSGPIDPYKAKSLLQAYNVIENNQKTLGPRTASMLDKGSTFRQQFDKIKENLSNLVDGKTTGQNMMSPEQVDQIASFTKQLYKAHSADTNDALDYYREDAPSRGLPPWEVDKIFSRFDRMRQSAQPDGGTPPPAPAPAAPKAPSQILTTAQQQAQAIQAKYESGGYSGTEKATARALLQRAGITPREPTPPPVAINGGVEG